jgi:hypothetical protein
MCVRGEDLQEGVTEILEPRGTLEVLRGEDEV